MINGFQEAIFDCGVNDLPLEGYPYTWEMSKGTDREVEEMLDRVFVSDEWRNRFPMNKMQNLVAPSSDHSAIYFQVQMWRPITRRARFRFENSWLRERRCSEIVKDCWECTREASVEKRIATVLVNLKLGGIGCQKSLKIA